jgi:hypothetical protein
MTVFGWWQGLTKETRFLGLVAEVDARNPVSNPRDKKPGFFRQPLPPHRPLHGNPVSNLSRFLTPGTRNRVSLDNLCLPTGPYIETRFLTSPGFSPLQGAKKPGFYDVCSLVARVDVNYPVSKRFDFGKEETGFL